MIVMMLEVYKPLIYIIVVSSKTPDNDFLKCNSEGASRGNPGPSGCAYCIRDSAGDFVYANSSECGID